MIEGHAVVAFALALLVAVFVYAPPFKRRRVDVGLGKLRRQKARHRWERR